MKHPRLVLHLTLMLTSLLLAACGGTPTTETILTPAATTIVSNASDPTPVPEVTEGVVVPTELVVPTETAAPPDATPVPADDIVGGGDTPQGRGYLTLVALEGAISMLDETAQQVDAGTLSGLQSFAAVVVPATLLVSMTELLDEPAPVPALEAAWSAARAPAEEARGIASRWVKDEIDSSDVDAALDPILARLQATIGEAEVALADAYNGSAADLRILREKTVAEMRATLTESLAATPEPGTTPAAEADLPAPSELGASRSTPLALGTPLRFESWAVTMTEVLQGPEAANAIAGANQFNDAAPEGMQYLLVTLTLQNISDKPEAQPVSYAVQLGLTGDRNIEYGRASVVVPEPLEGELFPAGVVTGQIPFLVPADETNVLIVIGEAFADEHRFVAVNEGATVARLPELAQIEVSDVGTRREAPAELGQTVTTKDWQVTLLEVVRGDEVMTRLTEANQFNDPPEAGKEQILVRARVKYIGTKEPDKTQRADGNLFKATGAANVIYDRISAVAPAPVLEATLYPGGEVEGWAVVTVAEGEQDVRVIFEPLFSFDTEQTRYLAIE